MPSRRFPVPRPAVLALAAAITFALVAVPTPAPSASAVDRQLLFGAYPRQRGTETRKQAVLRIEGQIGRPLAAIRVFLFWNERFPDAFYRWARDSGHALFISVKAKTMSGSRIPWRDIADAQPGSALYQQIADWADRIRNFGDHVYFTFHHEPEQKTNLSNGTAADFVAAWRNVVSIFRERSVTNAELVWIMTDYAFALTSADRRYAPYWYPGNRYVDDIAADIYNWFHCREGINNPWTSLQQLTEPLRQFALDHPTKGVYFTEWASVDEHQFTDAPQTKAQWTADAQAMMKDPSWAQLRGILYFNTQDGFYTNCRWWIDSSSSALQAFAKMANDPFYGLFRVRTWRATIRDS